MPARINKATLLALAFGAASFFAARIIFDNDEQLFECKGGNIYTLKNFHAVQEDGGCFTFNAQLSVGNSGLLSVEPVLKILPVNDPAFLFLDVTLFPKALDDGRPKGLEGVSITTLKFDSADGLSAAPAPLAPGYYVGNPEIRKEPSGNPLLFGCTNYRGNTASSNYNECRIAYRLKNGDTLSYGFAGIKGRRPSDWARIDKAVRDLIEAAEQRALSQKGTLKT